MNKERSIFVYVIIIVTVVLLLVGATYAYWIWGSARNNEANIALNVFGSSIDIYARIEGGEPINTEIVGLLPTSNCVGSTALQRNVSVTYKNGTSKLALVEAQLDLTEMSNIVYTNALTDTELSHMHWAITTNSASCSDNVVSSGTFEGMEFQSIYVNTVGMIGGHLENELSNMIEHPLYGNIFPLYNYYVSLTDSTIRNLPMISIAANANMANEVTNTYYLYIWIDENYTHTNYGGENSDLLSDLNFKLEWHGKIDQNLVCGDVTGDGVLNNDDYNAVRLLATMMLDIGARGNLLGDVSGDGQVRAADATILNRYILGYSSDPLNCPID